MVIFTSICANYAHKAKTLAKSVKECIPDATFVVCLTEREIAANIHSPYFDVIILAKDAWEGNFDRFIFKHTIVEASTAVKGQFFRHLYRIFPYENHFVYLDPDVFVYSDFIELRELLASNPIILCPHLLKPGNIDMELSSTAHGVYNLGFLAVNRSEEAQRFIDWWAERLYLFCYDDIQKGIFTDQKWVDLAPCFFNTFILKHHGYDFAPWSLLNCDMRVQDGQYLIENDPLRFIHFSGYGPTAQMCMDNWLPQGDHPFKDLYQQYSIIHDANDSDRVSRTPWSYSSYTSGEKVENSVRAGYRQNYEIMFTDENPFTKSNGFYQSMIRNKGNKTKMYYHKAVSLYREEGFSAVLTKAIKKLSRS